MQRIVGCFKLRTLLYCAALALALHASFVSVASAEASAAPADEYDEATELGLREFELGNYVEARTRFLDALATFPNARVLRALGKVEYELKSYVSAIGYLERSLVYQVKPLTQDQREDVTKLLTRARAYVGRYSIELVPSSASLRLDGHPLALDESRELLLQVGSHVLEAEAQGYMRAREELNVEGRKVGIVKLSLIKESDGSASSRTDHAPRADKPLYKKWWLWTSVALVVGAGVAAGAILATRDQDRSDPSGGSSMMVIPIPDEAARR